MTPPLGEHNNLSVDTTCVLDVKKKKCFSASSVNGTKVISPFSPFTPLIHAHPEVDAHGGDEAAGQERSVFKAHQ